MPVALSSFLLALFLICVAKAEIICDTKTMGLPPDLDCSLALTTIKGAKKGDEEAIKARRMFIEPQFLSPPFSKVALNPFDNEIVQIPKIWRYGKQST